MNVVEENVMQLELNPNKKKLSVRSVSGKAWMVH